MFKKRVKFVDYEENEQEVEYTFNITEAEAVLLEAKYPEGLTKELKRITDENDKLGQVSFFKELLMLSVGIRQGPLLIKNPEIQKTFEFSGAYNVFFMEIAQDENLAYEFVRGIMPKDTVPPRV